MGNCYKNTPSFDISFSVLGGWPHVALSRKKFAELMLLDCKNKNQIAVPKLAFSMNGQALSLTRTDANFRSAMEKADYIQADGQSLVLASRWLSNTKLPERIATTDFFNDAAEVASENSLRFYFLGATEEVLAGAIKNIKEQYPDLVIAGSHAGYFSEDEEGDICEDIVSSGTDVLWIGLGKPKEQIFSVKNKEKLAGVGWVKTCGGLFDFLSGKNSRAPFWMQKVGLEWFYRMCLEPRRLFARYMVTNIHAIFILATGKHK